MEQKHLVVLGPIFGAIAGYLLFNLAIRLGLGSGGMFALAGANILGGGLTAVAFKSQIKGRPNWPVAILGGFGILMIVGGLRATHHHLPASLAMESVYNTFAIVSWPLFLGLNRLWPTHFGERPNRFDLGCHALMAALVIARFATYPGGIAGIGDAAAGVLVAVAGYAAFNVAIKLAKNHRPTTVAMNLVGGLLLLTWGLATESAVAIVHLPFAGLLLGGAAILILVHQMGNAYAMFGPRGQGPLVVPLVYDGILVASPLMIPLVGERPTRETFVVALGMLLVTALRYRHHTHRKA